MTEEPYNAADRGHIKQKALKHRISERDRLETLRLIMSQRNGRGFILDLLNRCNIFSSSMSPDPHYTAFYEGERNVGLQLFADVVRECPDDYIKMMNEAHEKEQANANKSVGPASPEPGRSGGDAASDTGDSDNAGSDPTG